MRTKLTLVVDQTGQDVRDYMFELDTKFNKLTRRFQNKLGRTRWRSLMAKSPDQLKRARCNPSEKYACELLHKWARMIDSMKYVYASKKHLNLVYRAPIDGAEVLRRRAQNRAKFDERIRSERARQNKQVERRIT